MPKAARSTPRRLDQLDKNFQVKSAGRGLKWVDAFDCQLCLRGLAWPAENRKQKNFRRLPDRAEAGLSEGVRILSHCPSSVFLSFFTNSTAISVRLTVADLNQMNHMPATGMSGTELYFREGPAWHPVATAAPSLTETSFTCVLTEGAPRRHREYRLYLPLYKKVESVALGFEPSATVEPAPAPKSQRPIFFYGTSITQGGCANTAGSDYVSTIGRLLDTEVVNFGFSGSGKGEPEVARLIREVRAEMFVLDHFTNCKLETLADMLLEFVRILREKHPVTPIVLISCPAFNQILWNAKTRGIYEQKRDIVMRFYLQAKKSKDANIHYIDGPGLLPAGLTGTYVDGIHPTSAGFALFAERLAQQLHSGLSDNRRS